MKRLLDYLPFQPRGLVAGARFAAGFGVSVAGAGLLAASAMSALCQSAWLARAVIV